MGQGEEVKIRAEAEVDIQERGEIFFFYRPKVNHETAHGLDDVQRLFIILRPESGEKPVEQKQEPSSGKEGSRHGAEGSASSSSSSKHRDKVEGGHGKQEVNIQEETLLRLLVIAKKSLPDPSKKSQPPYWGFVELVTTKIEDMKQALQGEEYDTKTRGRRHKPCARALGEGIYRILRHKQSSRKVHTHLIYKLEFPPADQVKRDAQKSMNIEEEGSFVIQIRNPEQHGSSSGFRGLQSKRKSAFPAHLQAQLGNTRFHPADPPDFLNYEGCEFLLIAASDDIQEELGLQLETEGGGDPRCSDLVNTFGDSSRTTPLFEGTWD